MGKFKKTAKVIAIVALAVAIVCEVGLLARFLYLQNKQNAEKKQLNAYLAQIKELETMKDQLGLGSLSGVNGDFVAWIKCADIGLSMPVVQARADAADFYLSHDFKKNESIYGCPYVKSDCDLAGSLSGGEKEKLAAGLTGVTEGTSRSLSVAAANLATGLIDVAAGGLASGHYASGVVSSAKGYVANGFKTSDGEAGGDGVTAGGNSVIVGHSAFLGGVAIFSGFYDYLAPKQGFNFKINLQLLNTRAEYEIVSAFEVDGDDEDGLFVYNTTEFNSDNFARFQSIISAKNQTGRMVALAQTDTVLTIMTCSKHDLSKKVLVIAKMVG